MLHIPCTVLKSFYIYFHFCTSAHSFQFNTCFLITVNAKANLFKTFKNKSDRLTNLKGFHSLWKIWWFYSRFFLFWENQLMFNKLIAYLCETKKNLINLQKLFVLNMDFLYVGVESLNCWTYFFRQWWKIDLGIEYILREFYFVTMVSGERVLFCCST